MNYYSQTEKQKFRKMTGEIEMENKICQSWFGKY